VERIPERDAARRIDAAMTTWASRSRRTWKIDLGHMEERYGIRVVHERAQTDEVNRRLVEEARSRVKNRERRG
jgi:hypothetical protein